MAEESLHWADQIARELEQRVENEQVLKRIVKEKGYIVYDEKTPSGKIHIGSGRGWVIHDAIAKALRDIDLKARFILSSDDIDPYDKPNEDLPSWFNKYLGVPFRNIPSPVKGYKSFADYYFTQCTDKFDEFGINAELESTGERYIKGDFNRTIKISLDNAHKINKIYERFYGKLPEKLPFNPICEKCGKIGTTLAYEWDKERELVKYHCKEDLVKWAEGCGYKGEISPYNGNGKLPWKVEWAAKWPTVGVICELAGKDHFTHGGSRSIAVAICDEVFNFPPPYPSSRKSIGKGYEFFTIGGKKMSTSKGEGIGFVDSTEYAPANILRYLLVATRPRAVIDFDPINKNDLILLYERYDRTERVYYGKEKVENKHELQKQKRIYELSYIGKIKKNMPPQISFTHAAIIIQVTLNENKAIEMLKNSGHLPTKLTNEDIEYVKNRLKFAKKWVHSFAPEQYKFHLQKKISDIRLDDKQKLALKEIIEVLSKNKKITETELHNSFYEISRKIDLDPKDLFKAAYKVLINKEKGPRLASFILTIGKKKVIWLFEQVK
jgi:lysyl-tRNA synthetase class 1